MPQVRLLPLEDILAKCNNHSWFIKRWEDNNSCAFQITSSSNSFGPSIHHLHGLNPGQDPKDLLKPTSALWVKRKKHSFGHYQQFMTITEGWEVEEKAEVNAENIHLKSAYTASVAFAPPL